VSMTPSKGSAVCTHERGARTTVGVPCRYEARTAARARRKRLVLRSSAVAVVVATLGGAGVLGATAIRTRGWSLHAQSRSPEKPGTVVAAPTPTQTVPSSPAPTSQSVAAATIVTPHADPVTRPKAPFAPVVPQGASTLPDGPTAVRADSLVTVSFDTPMTRTRIPAKFERLVRTTLPAVYGRSIDSVLSKIPEGGIARQGDLVSELPTRGVRIPVNDAWTIALYPETRPGHDGPLVVRYRVSVVSKTE
jgi:hypothetical protein